MMTVSLTNIYPSLAEKYAGSYEADLIAEFDTYLPEHPPWLK